MRSKEVAAPPHNLPPFHLSDRHGANAPQLEC